MLPCHTGSLRLAVFWKYLAFAAISGSAGTDQAWAQPAQPSVQVPDTMKISRFVDLASEITGQPYSYNAQELDSPITIRVPGGLTKDKVPELVAYVLTSRGFTTIRTPGSPILSVVKLEQAAGLATTDDAGSAAFATEVISPKHQNAKSLADSIRGVLSKPGGSVTVLGDSNLLLISDLVPRIAEAKRLVEQLDTADPAVFHEVRLEHISASQAITMLSAFVGKKDQAATRRLPGELVASSDGTALMLLCGPEVENKWRDLIASIDHRESTESRTYTPRFFSARDVARSVETTVGGGTSSSDDRLHVVVDDLTGGLIVTATSAQHEQISALLKRLDSAERPPTPVRSFPIKNRPVGELLATLRELINSGALDSAQMPSGASLDAGRGELLQAGSQSSPRTPFPQQQIVQSSPTNGSTGTSPLLPSSTGNSSRSTAPGSASSGSTGGTTNGPGTGTSTRAPLSLTADESTNTLIAIGEPRLLEQLESLLRTLDVRQPQVMLEAILISLTDSQALSLGVELEKFGGTGDTSIKLSSLFGLSNGGPVSGSTSPGAGFSGIVLNPGELGIVVRALESLNRGKSLSQPKLLVTNNERAVFSSVLQQPITQTTRTGSNDTTFSYGGSESAGTTISVKPQIAQGDHLVLAYSIKLSNFVGSSSTAGLPPPKQENSVDSVATIPDGHAVVIGGLDITNETNGESRVPLIGRVPIIGELFKQRNDGSGRTRFYAFIRARVLRSNGFEDLKYISGRDANAMGLRDGWPTVEPRIIR